MIKIERTGFYDTYINERSIRYVRGEQREEADSVDVVVGLVGMDRPLQFTCADEYEADSLMSQIISKCA